MNKVLIGADPEVFLMTPQGKMISSVGLVGGTKDAPRAFYKDGFSIHEDNVTVEYNIPPADSLDNFMAYNTRAMEEVQKVAKDNGLEVRIVPEAFFELDQLQTKGAKEFGCNPDFNAWSLMNNPSPVPPRSLRTAGGHIHIGGDDLLDVTSKINLVRCLDIFLGIPLNLKEKNSKRNELYGSLGSCRSKPYGVEYRVPSNIWLTSDEIMSDVYTIVHTIASNLKHYTKTLKLIGTQMEEITVSKNYRDKEVLEVIANWLPFPSEKVYAEVV